MRILYVHNYHYQRTSNSIKELISVAVVSKQCSACNCLWSQSVIVQTQPFLLGTQNITRSTSVGNSASVHTEHNYSFVAVCTKLVHNFPSMKWHRRQSHQRYERIKRNCSSPSSKVLGFSGQQPARIQVKTSMKGKQLHNPIKK